MLIIFCVALVFTIGRKYAKFTSVTFQLLSPSFGKFGVKVLYMNVNIFVITGLHLFVFQDVQTKTL